MTREDEWMRVALEVADAAAACDEVPVGCVLVGRDGVEIGRGHNLRETTGDPTAHAEMLAVRAAAERVGRWGIEGATAYVTLEPCAMCAGAFVLARVARVVYGCHDPKAGALVSLYRLGEDARLNHRYEVAAGVRAEECAAKLSGFFAKLRAKKG
jgi:tRNA(adenine34) deaminase